ncbi:MAG: alkaline phosphatase D family protein [Pseudolysinimonas sp.]
MPDEAAPTSPFPYGVASGDVTHDAVVLWTKTAPGTTLAWWCEPVGGETGALTGEATSDETTGSVHVALTGLGAGVQHRYSFRSPDGESTEGQFRTIPTDRTVKFAVVSCAKHNSGFFNAYRAVARMDDLDFVLHLGDYIYEAAEVPTGKQTKGADIGRPMEPLNDCMTREDYDKRYALYRRDADLQLLHSRHAMMATIDDHELSDNAWVGGAQEHDDAVDGLWTDRVHAAMTVWHDWMPTMRRPQDGDPIWQQIDLGTAGRILLCETRLSRSNPDDPKTDAKTALGLPQREWALETLAEKHDGWTFLAVPSMMSDLDKAIGDEEALFALHKLKMAEADDPSSFHDLWDSFDFEQDALMDAVAADPRAIALSGDVHFSAEHRADFRVGEFVEWTVTSITSPNLDDKMGWPRGTQSKDYESAFLRNLPDLRWCDLDSHGFLVIEASVQRLSCQWWFVDTVIELSDEVVLGHEVVLPAYPEGTTAEEAA